MVGRRDIDHFVESVVAFTDVFANRHKKLVERLDEGARRVRVHDDGGRLTAFLERELDVVAVESDGYACHY